MTPALLVLAAGSAAAHGQFVFTPVCNNNWYGECQTTSCPSGGFHTFNNWNNQTACAGGLPLPGVGSTVSVGATTIHQNGGVNVAGLNTLASTVYEWDNSDLVVTGSITTPGVWNVRSGSKTLTANVVNTGVWNLRESWTLTLPAGVTFTNNNSVQLIDKDMSKIGAGVATIQNNGTLDQVGGTVDTWNGGLTIGNNGLLRSTAGVWYLDNNVLTSTPGASWVTSGGTLFLRGDSLSGTFNGAHSGAMYMGSGTTIAGATTLNLTGNGLTWADGDVTVNAGASLSNTGILTVGSGGKTLHGSMTNAGQLLLISSWTLGLDNSTLTNNGTVTLSDKDLSKTSGASGVINNNGLIDQTGGTVDTWNGGVTINNNAGGTIRSTSGAWYIDNNTLTSAASAQWATGGGGTLALRGDSLSGVYNFTNAGLTYLGSGTTIAANTVFTTSGVPVRWHDGDMTMAGGASLTVSAGGALAVGSGSKTLRGALINNGTLHMIESWTLILENASLDNTGVMNVGDKDMARSATGTGVINNSGTMDQTGGTVDTWNGGLTINNSGVLRSTAGTWFLDGGTLTSSGGQWNTGANGSLWLRGDTLHGTFNYANAGGINLASGVTFDANTVFAGSGNPVRWHDSNFTVAPGATLTVASGAALSIGSGTKQLTGQMINNGTLNLIESWGLTIGDGELTNNGTINVTDKDASYSGTAGRITNNGTMLQNGGTYDSWSGGLPIVNNGLMHCASGDWDLSGAALTNTSSGVLRSDSFMRLANGFTLGAGRMQGAGTFYINGTMTNSGGTAAPGNGGVGTLSVQGNYTQSGTGKLAIELASASSADKLQVTSGFPTGIATLGGTIEITRLGGYVPVPGARWTVLTGRVRNGQFAGVTAANPAPGISYRLLYPAANGNVDVLVLGACGPADVASQGGVPGPDNHLDNNDFVVYIDAFFSQDPIADVGVQGGTSGSDGLFDNNDFVVFINSFFIVCAS